MKDKKGKTIVLAVTGSIAAYKAADLASSLTAGGHRVRVVMTEAALRFVTPMTFETLTNQPVIHDIFEGRPPYVPDHVAIADEADLVVIAPATADIIGKIACGIADDFVSLTVMSTTAPVLIAPAMNDKMYANAILQANVKKLKELGYLFIEPEKGMLACKREGYGRLASVPAILDRIARIIETAS